MPSAWRGVARRRRHRGLLPQRRHRRKRRPQLQERMRRHAGAIAARGPQRVPVAVRHGGGKDAVQRGRSRGRRGDSGRGFEVRSHPRRHEALYRLGEHHWHHGRPRGRRLLAEAAECRRCGPLRAAVVGDASRQLAAAGEADAGPARAGELEAASSTTTLTVGGRQKMAIFGEESQALDWLASVAPARRVRRPCEWDLATRAGDRRGIARRRHGAPDEPALEPAIGRFRGNKPSTPPWKTMPNDKTGCRRCIR